jgi:hypothetical protein
MTALGCPGTCPPSTCATGSQPKGNAVESRPSLERIATIMDPAGELDGDERQRRAVQALARFERYIRPMSDGCHLWTGSLAGGYGQFALNGRLFLSRRLAYEIWTGRIKAHDRVFDLRREGLRRLSPSGGPFGGDADAAW